MHLNDFLKTAALIKTSYIDITHKVAAEGKLLFLYIKGIVIMYGNYTVKLIYLK